MPNAKLLQSIGGDTGITVYTVVKCVAGADAGKYLNDADGTFVTPAPADPYVALAEDGTIKGLFYLSESRAAWADGVYRAVSYTQAGGSPAPATDTPRSIQELVIQSDAEISLQDVDTEVDAVKAVTDKILFDGSNFVKTVQQGAVDILQTAADKVWDTTARSLTTFGSLTTDTATAVWANSTRTLSSFGTLIADIWVYATRALTDKAGFSVAGTVQTLDALNTALHADHVSLASGIAATATQSSVDGKPTLTQIEASTVLAKKADVAQAFVSVLPFSGSVQTAYAQKGATVEVIQGDSVSIPFDLATNLTGFTVWFGAKTKYTDTAYAITVKEITGSLTDVVNGRGLIPITAAESNITSGPYIAEIELRKDTQVITAMQFTLNIRGQVIS